MTSDQVGLSSRYRNKVMVPIVCATTIALVLDTSVSKIFHYALFEPFSGSKIFLFIAILIIYFTSQYFILQFAREKSKSINKGGRLYLALMDKTIPIVQILLGILIMIITSEIFFSESYDLNILIV